MPAPAPPGTDRLPCPAERWPRRRSSARPVPVATSALLLIKQLKGKRIGVITASARNLGQAHFAAVGAPVDTPFVGLPEDYYAWECGNALFIVLDPYWFTPARGQRDDPWSRTLGAPQYQWLKRTLAGSRAQFKFVFIHYLLGGQDQTARGGVAIARNFEWGGHDSDGSDAFAQHRPGWELPIHQLFVQHHVSIVFHGHDHLFAKEALDGVAYQLVPQPGQRRSGEEPPRSAQEYGYVYGDVLSASGHLRVTVAEKTATVAYVRANLPQDARNNHNNGEVAYSYTVNAAE
jgi:hypothetical protein